MTLIAARDLVAHDQAFRWCGKDITPTRVDAYSTHVVITDERGCELPVGADVLVELVTAGSPS